MIVEETLRRYEDSTAVRPSTEGSLKGPVILGNIEDDCHPLGRKIVASFLRLNGWDVRDLGIDVEAEALVDEAERVGAKVIGVSAMLFTTANNIRKVRQEIDRRGLTGKIMLAVGGTVFQLRPELVEEVGGDGSAPNAFAAVGLFERLLKQAEEGGE
jgi:methylmalonyl-CoA mutase cobalamin-binding domain/chain